MRFLSLITVLVLACEPPAPSVDPKVEEAVVAVEKFAAEAVAGDCAALKAGSEAVFSAEGLKSIEVGSPLESRVKAAMERIKPLLDACVAPAPAPVQDPIPVPSAPIPAPEGEEKEVQVAPDSVVAE